MKIRLLILSFVIVATPAYAADGAPPEILNKTIFISWSVQNTVIAPNGRVMTPTINAQRAIYISSAGRPFIKATTQTPKGDRTKEVGPGENTPAGGARDVHFESGKLIAMATNAIGAGRIVVSFDQTYSTCSVSITLGKTGDGPVMRRGPMGGMIQIKSQVVSGESCSIRAGNAVAE